MHLNYYPMQSQYKYVIQFVQQYKNLYAKFEAYLRSNEGLIRNSVYFWFLEIAYSLSTCSLSASHGSQSDQTL